MTPKEIRIKLGLTQQQFATKLGVSISTITRWETDGKSATKRISPLAQEKLDELIKEKIDRETK